LKKEIKKTKIEVIKQLSEEHNIKLLCEIANISMSAYYRGINRKDKDKEIKERIREIYTKHKGIYGYRRITMVLRREGLKINYKKVYRLMREMGLYARIRKKNYISRAAKETLYVSDNILRRNFKSESKHEKFVSDITEIKTKEGKLYLMIIQDLYNNEIVSYGISKSNGMELAHKVIDKWLKSGKYKEGSIFHTDRGFQFTHILTVRKLREKGIIQSMSRKGIPQDNGPAESFFSHFKEELVKIHGEKTVKEYERLIEEYIRFYNEERYQVRLKGMAPVEYRNHAV
jgi:putative transposase